MPPSAIASGTISFGLVTIPIKVYSANRSAESISFNLLHEKCSSRMKQYYRCPQCDEDVDRADMVKGYEFAKNQYVLFSKDELKSLEKKSTQSVEVPSFCPPRRSIRPSSRRPTTWAPISSVRAPIIFSASR